MVLNKLKSKLSGRLFSVAISHRFGSLFYFSMAFMSIERFYLSIKIGPYRNLVFVSFPVDDSVLMRCNASLFNWSNCVNIFASSD